jgi:hypothetical protein
MYIMDFALTHRSCAGAHALPRLQILHPHPCATLWTLRFAKHRRRGRNTGCRRGDLPFSTRGGSLPSTLSSTRADRAPCTTAAARSAHTARQTRPCMRYHRLGCSGMREHTQHSEMLFSASGRTRLPHSGHVCNTRKFRAQNASVMDAPCSCAALRRIASSSLCSTRARIAISSAFAGSVCGVTEGRQAWPTRPVYLEANIAAGWRLPVLAADAGPAYERRARAALAFEAHFVPAARGGSARAAENSARGCAAHSSSSGSKSSPSPTCAGSAGGSSEVTRPLSGRACGTGGARARRRLTCAPPTTLCTTRGRSRARQRQRSVASGLRVRGRDAMDAAGGRPARAPCLSTKKYDFPSLLQCSVPWPAHALAQYR